LKKVKYTIPSKNFVLLPEYEHAQHFLKTVYPYYPDCVIMTADKTLPSIEETYIEAIDLWQFNENIRIAVFGGYSLNKMPKPKSKHVVIMDMLLSHTEVSRKSGYNKESKMDLKPAGLAVMLDHHFGQRGPSQGQGRQAHAKPLNHWTSNLY